MRVTQLVIFSGAALWLAGAAGFANPQTDFPAPDPITPASGALDGLIAPDRRAEAESLLRLYLGNPSQSPQDKVPDAILRRAGQGDAKAQYVLGLCYNAGRGVETNLTEAVRWYRKAAEQDYPQAQTAMGYSYSVGEGVETNLTEAVRWFRKAADQDDRYAQTAMGYCYNFGRGVETNLTEAVRWFRKAAEQDHRYAQAMMGACYFFGEGVEKNLTEAVRWWRKAAEEDHWEVQWNLGISYYHGQGVETNLTEAVRWFRKAMEWNFTSLPTLTKATLPLCVQVAEEGLPNAQFLLGREYTEGKCGKPDDVLAYKYLLLATRQGHKEAKQLLPKVAGWLTKSDIAEATKMADEFKPEPRSP